MDLEFTPDAAAKIRQKVESGQCANTDEVIEEALRLLDEEETEHDKQQRLRERIDEGDKGEAAPLTRESWDDALERVRTSLRAGEPLDPDEPGVDGAS